MMMQGKESEEEAIRTKTTIIETISDTTIHHEGLHLHENKVVATIHAFHSYHVSQSIISCITKKPAVLFNRFIFVGIKGQFGKRHLSSLSFTFGENGLDRADFGVKGETDSTDWTELCVNHFWNIVCLYKDGYR